MTDEVELLNSFETGAIPQDAVYETPYVKIARAAKVLANDRCLKIPISFFKTKNFKPSISAAAKRVGIRLKVFVQGGIVHIWKIN